MTGFRHPILLILGAILTLPAPVQAAEEHHHMEQNGSQMAMPHHPAPATAETVHIDIHAATTSLHGGYEYPFSLTLRDPSGTVIDASTLDILHTKKIHLLAIDPTLQDYYHLHPNETATPGTYTTMIAPEGNGPYKVFLEARDKKSGKDLRGVFYLGGSAEEFASQVTARRTDTPRSVINGYDFYLYTEDGLAPHTGKATQLNVRIVRVTDDEPVKTLQPIMGAFAHLVGFSQDAASMVHMHPTGPEPQSDKERGGPLLSFHFTPPAAGIIPLFLQVHIDNEILTVPFTLKILP